MQNVFPAILLNGRQSNGLSFPIWIAPWSKKEILAARRV
jgi:hypothetical protein